MAISKGYIGKRFGFHSGNLTVRNLDVIGDLTIGGDIIIKDISAGRLAEKTTLPFKDQDGATVVQIGTNGDIKLMGEVKRV